MIENFIAIDVETANGSRGSICQIGVAAYSGSNRSWVWSTLVNPEEAFDEGNIRIHGIRSHDVQSAPRYPNVFEELARLVRGQFVVSHSRFDCDALHEASSKYGLDFPEAKWIDSCRVARLAWPTLRSHALDVLCGHLSIELKHHDAASDAVACAEVLTHAVLQTRMGIARLADETGFVRPPQGRPPSSQSGRRYSARRYSERLSMAGSPAGPLTGEILVCTGDFEIGEAELVKLAANLGCNVEDRFSKKRTTMLVVGTRDPAQFNDKVKSNKLLAAEAAIAKGRQVAILSEDEFLALARSCCAHAGSAGAKS